MKTNHAVNIFIVLILGITLVGCNPQLNSIAAINKSEFESFNAPAKIKSTENILVQLEPVAILFLIDKSSSVIGEGDGLDKCDVDIPKSNLPHVGAHYIATVLSHLPAPYSEYIHFGVNQFGNGSSSVIGFTLAKDLENSTSMRTLVEEDAYTDLTTNYAYALDKGYKDLKAYSSKKGINKQIIIILTDGLGVNRDSTEKVLENIPPGVQIYANLVCPDTQGDTSFWAKHRIPKSEFPIKWLTDFWQIPDLKQALPPKSGWIQDGFDQKILISGDVNQVDFKYFSWTNSDDINFEVDGNIVDQNDLSFSKIPKQGCAEHTFSLGSRISDAGFCWAEIKTPSIDEITLSSENLINDSSVKITAHLSGKDFSSGEMEKWRDCYKDFSFEFITSDGHQFNEQPFFFVACVDGGTGLCPEKGGNGLYGTWLWYPPKLSSPVDISVKIKLTAANSSDKSIEFSSKPYTLPVIFKPEYNLIIPNFRIASESQYFFDLKFYFDTNRWKPNIYLLKTVSIQNTSSAENCPATQSLPNISLPAYFVQQNSSQNNLWAKSNSSWAEGVGSYQLSIDKVVIDICGFEKVIFIWKASTTLHLGDSIWTCDLRKLTCED